MWFNGEVNLISTLQINDFEKSNLVYQVFVHISAFLLLLKRFSFLLSAEDLYRYARANTWYALRGWGRLG